uniref:Uncharacterized protein n=1 Tax=Oryza rufipogon TaxID=4529 RepID=A0A0E0N910_ORYRU
MTPTILAALSAACVKPAGKVVAGDDLLGLAEKHSRLSSSHSPAISRRTCSSASPAASPGFSLRRAPHLVELEVCKCELLHGSAPDRQGLEVAEMVPGLVLIQADMAE